MAGQIQGGSGGPNMEQFEAYFKRADLDHDGRISGAEAVSFFQGSNLSKPVLAQIWNYADQKRTGYLGRAEFYNALKLVTVAQSKRELTPEMVNAALYGPASAKIPAPQINLAAIPSPQSNSGGVQPTLQGGVPSTTSQSPGLRGNPPPITNVNHPYFPSQGAQSMRPPFSTSLGVVSQPRQGVRPPAFPGGGTLVGQSFPNTAPNLPVSGAAVGISTGFTAQINNRAASPSALPVAPKPQDNRDPKAVPGPGNGVATDSMFGGNIFSAAQSTPKQTSLVPVTSASSTATQSAIVQTTSPTVSLAKPDPLAVLQSTYNRPSTDWQTQQTQSFPKPNQQLSTQATTSAFSQPGISTSVGGNLTSDQSQPWPKMTRLGVQKYEKVFREVDTDRDGRITGEEARNLFLSWRLPREVLKQVWDLSDQDNDSMLSLREFSIALYLMERYREGRTLPSTLPESVILDETLLSMAGPPSTYGNRGWSTSSGLRPHQVLPGSHSGIPGRPPLPVISRPDGSTMNARGSSGENSHVHELSNGNQSSLDLKDERLESDNKVENRDKVILDSKEKLEFYRTKMQDLVLYKSRCDNQLNEITERAIADKREAELLARNYEERYKLVAEMASKLTIEEASFRDIQARKMELQQAIIKVEQGGSADGILQVRADRIQSDLDDLLKALAEYSKTHSVQLKSTTVLELPPGWQPGIPEISAPWDEEWDKFNDEGFLHDVAVPVTADSTSPEKEYSSPSRSISPDAISTADKSVKGFDRVGSTHETESSYAHSEGETNSLHGSPIRQTEAESVFHDFSDDKNGKSFDMDAESHGGFEDSTWGTFDNNDDVDSVWGFNPKDPESEKHGDKYFFDSNDFGTSPSRLDSPRDDDSFQKHREFRFEDSTHGSPLSKASSNSPKNSFFDSFSRYDSFSVPDHGSPRRESLTRFDSMKSSASFDHSRGFSFDDSDPFGSTGPFKVSSDSQSQKKGSDSWSSF